MSNVFKALGFSAASLDVGIGEEVALGLNARATNLPHKPTCPRTKRLPHWQDHTYGTPFLN